MKNLEALSLVLLIQGLEAKTFTRQCQCRLIDATLMSDITTHLHVFTAT